MRMLNGWCESICGVTPSMVFRVLLYASLGVILLPLVALHLPPIYAQSTNAGVSGEVTDQQNAVIPDVEVDAKNTDTGITYPTKTNKDGFYSIPNLPPGNYLMNVRKPQFRSVTATGITLHVQDQLSKNFVLQVGSVDESVTVSAEGNNINTTDGSVSTVIDNRFVENLPLNGRSFSSLLELTPGAVQNPGPFGGFNVNGQRDNTNYYVVDGVSANFGIGALYQPGQGPATTSFGGTNSLLSIDSLQEFRILTSSFAPEFGRTLGGQVEVTTKSGTNSFHGDLFDYFRNNALDSNDWFYDQALETAPPGTVIPPPALRQNDFGGVFGGPIIKDKTFFFASYEGLRLVEPQVQDLFVPDVASRQSIPAPLNQLLNAFPLPNGPDQGNGFAAFTQTASATQTLDVGAIRIDHELTSKILLFGRASFAASSSQSPFLNQLTGDDVPTRFVTVGVNSQTMTNLSEQFRFNYSLSRSHNFASLSNAEGAVAPDLSLLVPSPYTNQGTGTFEARSDDGANYAYYSVGSGLNNSDRQFNAVGDLSYNVGRHTLKFGVDYRNSRIESVQSNPYSFVYAPTISDLVAGGSSYASVGTNPVSSGFTANNWSIYAQDTWRIGQRLVLTYGLRWDVNPGPTATPGSSYLVGQNITEPASLTVSPTSHLWTTKYGNVAPRIGLAWMPFGSNRVVFRSGFGVFYDTGVSPAGAALSNAPAASFTLPNFVSLPLVNPGQYVPSISLTPPFGYNVVLTDPGINLPYSLQWNLALEISPRRDDSVSVTYVGQAGRRLLSQEALYQPNSNFSGYVEISENQSRSNYDALQVQYRHRLSQGLQALANYTWSHSLDDQSRDITSDIPFSLLAYTNQYGSSDFDVRQNFSAAITYDLPTPSQTGAIRKLFGGWGLDSIVYARTGFPIDVEEGDPSTAFITLGESRPDVVPGQPFYVATPGAPGGKSINPAAFALRPPDQQGDLPRNGVPGFGYTQWDTSIRRAFSLSESKKLILRLDLFNALNHPNFANPSPFFSCVSATPPQQCSISNGQSTEMLNQSLNGLSSIYQNGGPRSLQVSLKFQF
jgi:carboxypeptidase family protein